MQKLSNRDVICAGVLVVFSVAVWIQALALPSRAAMFPRLVIALLFGFSVIYLARSVWRASPERPAAPFFRNAGRLCVALMLIVGYVLIFPRIGFFTATVVFIPVFSIAIGLRRIVAAVLASMVFTTGAWIVFVLLLGRRLPPEKILTWVTGTVS